MTKIVIIHGNGGAKASEGWIPSVATALRAKNLEVIAETFPDNVDAKASVWLPYIESLGADRNTIIIGHSSGALAAMAYAQDHELRGSILVGAAHTDLGEESEKISGYFDNPWQWDKIKANQSWIIQFASTDDPYIPMAEQQFVHDRLSTDLHQFNDRGHFETTPFPELIEALLIKLEK